MNVNGITSASPAVVLDQNKNYRDVETKEKVKVEEQKVRSDDTVRPTNKIKDDSVKNDKKVLDVKGISYEERLDQVMDLEAMQRLLLLIPPYKASGNNNTLEQSGHLLDIKK